MADSENMMTIEDLAEIYRVEKKSGSLMTLRPDFYKATALLLKAQRSEYDNELSKDPDSIRCEGANSRRKKGKQLSGEIIEMRMGKICKMALRGAMGADNILDSLTQEEKDYYERILRASKEHKAIMNRLSGSMTYRTPDITSPQPAMPVPAVQEASDEPAYPEIAEIPMDTVPDDGIVDFEHDPDMDVPEIETQIPDDELDSMAPDEPPVKAGPVETPRSDQSLVLVRILEDIPTFSGPLREYTLYKEDVVRLPEMLAQVLLNRNLAQKITVSP